MNLQSFLIGMTLVLASSEALAQTCPRVNVASYNTNNNWSQAFTAAIAAQKASCGGGAVYVPAGTYNIATGIDVPSNITIEGDGAASKIVLTGSEGFRVCDKGANCSVCDLDNPACTGASDVSFRGLNIDLQVATDFETAISFLRGQRHSVTESRFFSSTSISPGFTIHAVVSEATSGLVLTNNFVDALQFKVGRGGAGGPDTIIANNRFRNARNYAASVVSSTGGANLGVNRVIIEGNIASELNGASGGFYVGTDGDIRASHALQDVIIKGNVVSATTADASFTPILVRAGNLTRRVVVADNTIATSAGVYGCITVKDYDSNTTAARSIAVHGNQIEGCQYGIRVVTLGIENFDIADNQIHQGSLYLGPSHAGGFLRGSVHDNVITNGVIQLIASNHAKGIRFSDNVVDCNNASSPAIQLQAMVAGLSIDVDLAGNTVRGCGPYYVEYGSGTFSGTRQ